MPGTGFSRLFPHSGFFRPFRAKPASGGLRVFLRVDGPLRAGKEGPGLNGAAAPASWPLGRGKNPGRPGKPLSLPRGSLTPPPVFFLLRKPPGKTSSRGLRRSSSGLLPARASPRLSAQKKFFCSPGVTFLKKVLLCVCRHRVFVSLSSPGPRHRTWRTHAAGICPDAPRSGLPSLAGPSSFSGQPGLRAFRSGHPFPSGIVTDGEDAGITLRSAFATPWSSRICLSPDPCPSGSFQAI